MALLFETITLQNHLIFFQCNLKIRLNQIKPIKSLLIISRSHQLLIENHLKANRCYLKKTQINFESVSSIRYQESINQYLVLILAIILGSDFLFRSKSQNEVCCLPNFHQQYQSEFPMTLSSAHSHKFPLSDRIQYANYLYE